MGDDLVVFVPESAQGEDRNGDRDLADAILHVVDRDGIVRNTRVAGEGFDVHEGAALFSRDEVADQRDWNGDGDRLDSVLFAFDPVTSSFSGLGMAPFQLQRIRGERALISVLEGLDEHADLNEDGDQDDLIYAIQELATGRRLNTGLSLTVIQNARATADGSFLLSAWELQEGRDLNGDGDLDDFLLHVAE